MKILNQQSLHRVPMCKLGVMLQSVVDRSYHNRSKVDTHLDGYVTM